MTARFTDHILPAGDHASLPDPATTPEGAVYPCTDHATLYRNEAGAWETWAVLGDPGTATALSDHLTDPTDAHDASAISVTPTGGLAANDVQAALAELDTEKAAAGHTHALDDLSDVDLTGATTGQALVKTAGGWGPASVAAGATTLNGLTDVDTATVPPTTGQALVWDGTQWEPGSVSSGGGGGSTAGTYRGAWALSIDVVRGTYDFASGTIPSIFTTGGSVSVAAYAAPAGGAVVPEPSKRLFIQAYGSNAYAYAETTPNLIAANLGVTAINKVRFWFMASTENGYDFGEMTKNGAVQVSKTGAGAWSQATVSVSTTDALRWLCRADSSGFAGENASSLANLEAIETVTPNYQVNDLVSHQGAVYACNVALTTQEPGTGSDWTLIRTGVRAINAQTGTSYTLTASDVGKKVSLANAAAITLTVPTNAAVPMPVGAEIDLLQTGAGQVTVAGASGVTVNAVPGLKLAAQYSAATLTKLATDTWLLVGRLSA